MKLMLLLHYRPIILYPICLTPNPWLKILTTGYILKKTVPYNISIFFEHLNV
jgi:hypothetical protein